MIVVIGKKMGGYYLLLINGTALSLRSEFILFPNSFLVKTSLYFTKHPSNEERQISATLHFPLTILV
jgi:hypothetical protein